MDVEGSSSFSFLVLEELYISQGSDVHFFFHPGKCFFATDPVIKLGL